MALAQDLIAAGRDPRTLGASLLFAGARNQQSRSLGRGDLTNAQQVAASIQGLNTDDQRRVRWDETSGRWKDGGQDYVGRGDTFNYAPMLEQTFKPQSSTMTLSQLAKSGGAYTGGAIGGPPSTTQVSRRGNPIGINDGGVMGLANPLSATPIGGWTDTTTPNDMSASPPATGGNGLAPSGSAPTGGAGTVGYGVNIADYLDPSMRFQMGEGIRALENSAAARGSLMSGGTLRDLLRYSQGLASTDYGNAFGRAANVRDFTYGVDAGDRAFDYNAQRDDRNFNYGTLRDLANMGLSSASQSSNSGNALAGILASILANRGQIEGTGAIGGSNAVNGSISQILNMLLASGAIGNVGGK